MRAALILIVVTVSCSSPAPPVPPSPSNATPTVAAPPPPAPMTMGGFPVPPRQGTAYSIQARGLPAKLISAVETLFRQGFADPRGCAYRELELATGSVWSGTGEKVATRGWVLPSRDAGKTWAIAWNGLVYPVISAGAAADVRADLEALIRIEHDPALQKARRHHDFEAAMVAHDTTSAAKVMLLLQLGEAALATELWNLSKYAERLAKDADPYMQLAEDWAWSLYDRTLTGHMRGDHPLALAGGRMLVAIQRAIEAEADRRGINRPKEGPNLDFLDHLPVLVADEERRARLGPRTPLDPKQLATLAPEARVTQLIDHLDEVAARQWGQPGGVDLGGDPIVGALIDHGAAAVEPLLAVLEADTRLTRSVHFWRDFARQRNTIGVHEAAYVAITGILEQSFFDAASTGDDLSAHGLDGRRAVAAQVRAYWDRWKSVPLEERWYRALGDDAQKPEDWLDAADKITQPTNVSTRRGSMVWTTTTVTKSSAPPGLRGESLRTYRSPTVFELIAKRMTDKRVDLRGACAFAQMLVRWDPRPALPLMTQQLARAIAATRQTHEHGRCVATLASDLAGAGQPAAIDTYAAWLATTTPPSDGVDREVFDPMVAHARRPSVVKAAQQLFRDGSPWVPFVSTTKNGPRDRGDLLESGLLALAAFRAHVGKALSDTRTAGTLAMGGGGGFSVDLVSGGSMSTSDSSPGMPPEGTTQLIRVADWYAWTLSRHHDNAPRFQLYWPAPQRDAALVQIRTWVQAQP